MVKKVVFLILGGIFTVLGIIGIILPVIPQVPFLLAALFCFIQSSKRVENWFRQSVFYTKYLKDIKESRGIRVKEKLVITILTTISMGAVLIWKWDNLWIRYIDLGLWICYMIYFWMILKNVPEDKTENKVEQ